MDDQERRDTVNRIMKEIHELGLEGEIFFRLSVWLRKVLGR